MTSTPASGLLERVYRQTLHLLPRSLRSGAEREMTITFRSLVESARARGGRKAAIAAAIAEIGDVISVSLREHVRRAMRARDRHAQRSRGDTMMSNMMSELGAAFNGLRRAPGFTVLATITLALGIAGVTAMFAFVDGVLLRPLPYHDADRLVEVWRHLGGDRALPGVDAQTFRAWREQRSVFEDVTAIVSGDVLITGTEEPERIGATWLAPDVFDFLGIAPSAGRTFSPGEGDPGAGRVVVLAHGVAREWFGSAEAAVGRDVRLNGEPHIVVGVAPPGFHFPFTNSRLYLPFYPDEAAVDRFGSITALGRLQPGLGIDQANRMLEAQATRMREDGVLGGADGVQTVDIWWARVPDPTGRALIVLLAAVGFVLLIACLNAANLAMVRSSERAREVAVRAALGAGRWRLGRLAWLETVLVGVLAAVCGLLLAWAAVTWGSAHAPAALGLLKGGRNISLDGRIVAFGLIVTSLCALFFGTAPALQAMRADARNALGQARGSSGGVRGRRVRSALMGTEIAAAILLLTGAAAMLRSFSALDAVDTGLEMEQVLAIDISLPRDTYQEPAERRALFDAAEESLASLPGVRGAAFVAMAPPGAMLTMNLYAELEGTAPVVAEFAPRNEVGWNYFDVMGIPLIEGRTFGPGDAAGDAVIVNEVLARRLSPDGGLVGRRIRLSEDGEWRYVVGVAADVKQMSAQESAETGMDIYEPYDRATPRPFGAIVLRVDGNPLAVVPAVKERIWAIDPDLPLPSISTIAKRYSARLERPRFHATLMGVFAAVATLIAAAGVFSVVAYTVSRRTREIGIRMALGARSIAVLGFVLRDVLITAAAGIAAGVACALLLGRFLEGMLFEVRLADPLMLAGVAFLLLMVAGAASWLPARRAVRVDPMRAVGSE